MTRLLPLLLCLLLIATQERPWTARVWDNGDTPVTEPILIDVWGDAELRLASEANPRTHGVVNFYVDAPCWRVSVWAGERRWLWEDMRGCWRYHFPVWPQVGR